MDGGRRRVHMDPASLHPVPLLMTERREGRVPGRGDMLAGAASWSCSAI